MVRSGQRRVDRPRPPERGATRTQHLVLLILVVVACALTAILLWSRLAGGSGLAFPLFG
jgi:hypothetical protein